MFRSSAFLRKINDLIVKQRLNIYHYLPANLIFCCVVKLSFLQDFYFALPNENSKSQR